MKIVNKGWGYEKWIVNKKEYCGKFLYFNKGKKCSFHYHRQKDETFYLQSGKMLIRYCDIHDYIDDNTSIKEMLLNPGGSFYVPICLIHQMIALENSELFEFSTEHFEEDSYRLIKGD